MAGKKQKQEGVGAWIAIVILFAVGLWPIALVMLLVKLFGNDGQKRRPVSYTHLTLPTNREV